MSANLEYGLLPGVEATSSVAPPPDFGEWSQVAPGQFVTGIDEEDLPSYTLARIIPGEGDDFTLQPDGEALGWVRLTESMAFAKALKIEGLSYATMRRLLFAGFVDYLHMTPGTYFVSLDSLMAHLQKTKNSPHDAEEGFWTEEKIEHWRSFCDV